jgi:hypothetical protein
MGKSPSQESGDLEPASCTGKFQNVQLLSTQGNQPNQGCDHLLLHPGNRRHSMNLLTGKQ